MPPRWDWLGATVVEWDGSRCRINAPPGLTFWVADFMLSFQGCEAINPLHGETTGAPQNFIVGMTLECKGDGDDWLELSPTPMDSGPYRNVNLIPVTGCRLYGGRAPAASTVAQGLAHA